MVPFPNRVGYTSHHAWIRILESIVALDCALTIRAIRKQKQLSRALLEKFARPLIDTKELLGQGHADLKGSKQPML
jgi:hypothetical protein